MNERITKLVFLSFTTLVSLTALLCAFTLFDNPEMAMQNFPYHAYYPDFVPIVIKAWTMNISVTWNAITIVVHDCLIMALMNHICAQLMVLEISLTDLNGTKHKKPPLKQLKQCIRHHQMIISLRNEIESIFSYMLLLQFLASLFIFGLTGFQATVGSYRQFMVYAYCCCVLSELFIYCWFAHQVLHQVSDRIFIKLVFIVGCKFAFILKYPNFYFLKMH